MEYTKIISLKFTDSEYNKLEELIKNTHKNRSEFIRDRIFGDTVGDTSDTTILRKLIKPFAEAGVRVDLDNHEIERIKQLWEEIL